MVSQVDGQTEADARRASEAAAQELELHAPEGYTGPQALCGYADHLAPARQDGTLDVHERTHGTMGHCPGSL